MLDHADLIGFVPTTDPARARAFYESTLGLRLVEATDFAVVFDANGTMLRITTVPGLEPAAFTVLGWRVDDITGTVTRLTDNGVDFRRYDGMDQDASGIWTTPGGDKVAWFADPDGNVLSLTEFG
jgi:catechol 2,3-dioxygenase-like lactoylglutathione lyase family enzyme